MFEFSAESEQYISIWFHICIFDDDKNWIESNFLFLKTCSFFPAVIYIWIVFVNCHQRPMAEQKLHRLYIG